MLENVSKMPFKKHNVQTVQNFLNIDVQTVQKCLWHYRKPPARVFYMPNEFNLFSHL